MFQLLETELRSRASISIHFGKTKLWNASGTELTGVAGLSAAARMHDPQAVVWRGDQGLPTAQQGLKVLGAPVGHPDFIRSFLSQKRLEHDHLFEMIPQVPNVQAAWLLLVFFASTRANFFLRTVAPEFTFEFAERHDEQVFKCLSKVLQTETLHPRNHEAARMVKGVDTCVWDQWQIPQRLKTMDGCQDPKLGGACRRCETRDEEIEGS